MFFRRSRKIKEQPTEISCRKNTFKGAKTNNLVQSRRIVKKEATSYKTI